MHQLETHDSTAKPKVEATTPFGKEITIDQAPNTRMLKINVSGGGKFPPELDGHFISYKDAKDAIHRYIELGKGREVKDE